MGRITVEKALTSAAYGLLDIGMKELDVSQKWTKTFQNATDISRAAVCLASLAANFITPRASDFTEVLFYSSLPKLEESLYNATKEAMKPAGTMVAPPVLAVPKPAPVAPVSVAPRQAPVVISY